jgi:hypothetical protein
MVKTVKIEIKTKDPGVTWLIKHDSPRGIAYALDDGDKTSWIPVRNPGTARMILNLISDNLVIVDDLILEIIKLLQTIETGDPYGREKKLRN